MSFNIGLSALAAAQQDINVTGNNIANAGTHGFKGSRASFGDVYAASILGGGQMQQGSGVALQEIKQNFNQGNISFTDSTLDLAINGEGFFILRSESGVAYTRAGSFGTDNEGYVVNGLGDRLQGFAPSPTGQATGGGPLTDLRVTTGELQPRPTSAVESVINVDAAAAPSTVVGSTLASNAGQGGAPQQANNNGYQATTLQVVGSDRQVRQINIAENASANAVAQTLSGIQGVTARGTTVAYIDSIDATTEFRLNGRDFIATGGDAAGLEDLAQTINAELHNVSARVVDDTIEIIHSTGADLRFVVTAGPLGLAGASRDQTTDQYEPGTFTTLTVDETYTVGGLVDITMDENVSIAAAEFDTDGNPVNYDDTIFGTGIDTEGHLAGVPFETNQFDPRNPDTYYRSTAVSVYDTVGSQHALSMYFVKERPDDAGNTNLWSVYFQIDGEDIGYDPNSPDGEPVLARYDLIFDETGRYDTNQPPIVITNWHPTAADGRRLGAGPVPGDPNVTDQLNNSNFSIDLSGLTAFGGDFSVQANNQDGYAKGQLTGLEVNGRGMVSARFSNGKSQVLGEVALANFANAGGLANVGGTRFAETSESGSASVSGAGTAGLGAIQSGALEDSNVDLPTQLVQLIIAQRNYQAAAQVISATDNVTQTIINL